MTIGRHTIKVVPFAFGVVTRLRNGYTRSILAQFNSLRVVVMYDGGES